MKALVFLALLVPALASAQTAVTPQYNCQIATVICQDPVAMMNCFGLGEQGLAVIPTANAVAGKAYADSTGSQHLVPSAQISVQGNQSLATISADLKDATGKTLISKSVSMSLSAAGFPNQLAMTVGMNSDNKIPVSGNAFAVVTALCTKK